MERPPAEGRHLNVIEQGIMSQITPDMQDDLERIVLSGKQILYHPNTRDQVIENMRDIQDDSDPRKVALGVAGILTIINRKAEQIPVELMVPAGALLCVEVARFFQESGRLALNPVFTGNMVEEFLAIVMQKMGMGEEPVRPPGQPEIPGGVSPPQEPPRQLPPAPPVQQGLIGAPA